jgi:hypothetical protein
MADEQKEPAVKEQPTLAAPAPAGDATPQDPTESARVVLETLNKLGIDSEDPQAAATKLENMHFASIQAGRYANDLGAERQRAQALEARLAALEAERRTYRPQDDIGNIYGEQQPAVPSIRPDDIRKVMREEIGNYVNMQQQATQAQLQEYAKIRGDAEYGVVEDLFNKHIANPHVQIAMQSRQTTLSEEYNRVKTSFYKNLAKQSRDALQNLLSQTQKVATPPHMEQSVGQAPGMPVLRTSKDQLMELHKKSRGTDDDLDAMLNAILPDTDQFLYQAEEVKQGRLLKGR